MSRTRQYGHVVALLVAALVVVSGCGSSEPEPVGTPDPGHRIMRHVAPVLTAVPSTARVTVRQRTEPVWDSCDGETGTFGWTIVTVLAEFRGGGSRGAIVSQVRDAMRRLGWTYLQGTSGRGIWYWDRSVSHGELAHAELDGPSQGTDKWDLLARAQPSARRVRGC